MNKIFNWKNFSILYLLYWLILSATTPIISYFSTLDIFVLIVTMFCQIFGFGLCVAIGWKKQFFSTKLVIFFTLLSVLSFPVTVLSGYFNSPEYGFLTIAIGGLIISFPMWIAFFIYLKNRNTYNMIEKPFLKLFCAYYAYSILCGLIRLILLNHNYNIFDYINILSGLIIALFVICYAWNYRIKNVKVIKTFAIYLMIAILLPLKLLSVQFLYDTGIQQLITNPLGFVYVILMTVFQLFIIYKYAFR